MYTPGTSRKAMWTRFVGNVNCSRTRYIPPLRMVNVACTSIGIPLMVEFKTYSRPNMTFRALGGGFKYFLFSPLLGEMIQFDLTNIFQLG